jgi:hypothetical protein
MIIELAKREKGHVRRGFLAVLALTCAGAAACARPAADMDLSLNRTTDDKLFRVRAASETNPIPMSKMHRWSLHVDSADGLPVTGARLEIDGGMPEHGHGLPTAPRAEPGDAPGDYVINGMKFSMPGWWVLKVNVQAPNGRTDKVTFNVVL